jgi:hypothetical protein
LDGVFWYDDIGFVVDKHMMQSTLPNANPLDLFSLDGLLMQTAKLPNLGAAPIASWLLARLMRLTTEGLGFEANAKLYHDGGGFYLNFIAFSRAIKPLAFFSVHGTCAHCNCWGQCAESFQPTDLTRVFVDALVENVDDLMECKLTYYDTDPPDLEKRRVGNPRVLGWDGTTLLGFRTKYAK